MRCPNCARKAGWARLRCPACKTKLIQWYIVAGVVVVVGCLAGLLITENIF